MKLTTHIISSAEIRNEWRCTFTPRHAYIHTKYRCKLISTLLNDRERERGENVYFVSKLIFLIFTVSV